jgi:ABC-type dipeptide/oligopeptide/nickel transport system permease component
MMAMILRTVVKRLNFLVDVLYVVIDPRISYA